MRVRVDLAAEHLLGTRHGIFATWPRSSSRARLISTSISARAASSWLLRAASPSAFACSTMPFARVFA
jgi:hypothetical protein